MYSWKSSDLLASKHLAANVIFGLTRIVWFQVEMEFNLSKQNTTDVSVSISIKSASQYNFESVTMMIISQGTDKAAQVKYFWLNTFHRITPWHWKWDQNICHFSSLFLWSKEKSRRQNRKTMRALESERNGTLKCFMSWRYKTGLDNCVEQVIFLHFICSTIMFKMTFITYSRKANRLDFQESK